MPALDRLLVREIAQVAARRNELPEEARLSLSSELAFLKGVAEESRLLDDVAALLPLLRARVTLHFRRLDVRLSAGEIDAILVETNSTSEAPEMLSRAYAIDRTGLRATAQMIRDLAGEGVGLSQAKVMTEPRFNWLRARWPRPENAKAPAPAGV